MEWKWLFCIILLIYYFVRNAKCVRSQFFVWNQLRVSKSIHLQLLILKNCRFKNVRCKLLPQTWLVVSCKQWHFKHDEFVCTDTQSMTLLSVLTEHLGNQLTTIQHVHNSSVTNNNSCRKQMISSIIVAWLTELLGNQMATARIP